MMYGPGKMEVVRSLRLQDPSLTQQKLKSGTIRRIVSYARP